MLLIIIINKLWCTHPTLRNYHQNIVVFATPLGYLHVIYTIILVLHIYLYAYIYIN